MTDELNYNTLALEFWNKRPYFTDPNGVFFIWNENQYVLVINKEQIRHYFFESMPEMRQYIHKSSQFSSLYQCILEFGYCSQPKRLRSTQIAFKNFIVDYMTMEQIPPSSEYMIINPIPHRVIRGKSTDIRNLIRQWTTDKKERSTMIEYLAYIITPDYFIQKFLCLIGYGHNGKTQYKTLAERLVGKRNYTTLDFKQLEQARFQTSKLYKKRLCTMSEVSVMKSSETSTLKNLTGGDVMPFEFKNQHPFDDYNTAKILLVTNFLPIPIDDTDGYYRRWLLIFLTKTFEKNNINMIASTVPEKDFEKFCWEALFILKALKTRKTFKYDIPIDDMRRLYGIISNPVFEFYESQTEEGEGDERIQIRDFFTVFNTFWKQKTGKTITEKTQRFMLQHENILPKYEQGNEYYLPQRRFSKTLRVQSPNTLKLIS